MRLKTMPLVVIVLSILASATGAQPRPTTQPRNAVIPELNFQGTPFDSAMEYLRENVSGFQVQVLRDPGVEYPQITLRAKNVTIGQVMDFLTSAYEVEWEQIDGPSGAIVLARLRPSPRLAGAIPTTRVFPLNWLGGDGVKVADILSVLQAAVEQAGIKGLTLKVHEGSRVLLATGDFRSLQLVEQTIGALRPSEDVVKRQYENKLQETEAVMRMQRVEFEAKVRTMEIERARLEQATDARVQQAEQAMRAQQVDLQSRIRQLEQELAAVRARGNQP